MYASASAFAPICSPTRCPWGTKAFEGYLGSVEAGRAHDAIELINGLSSGDGLELQHGQSARLAVLRLAPCTSSGRSWRLWAARHFHEETGSLSAQPLPPKPPIPPPLTIQELLVDQVSSK